jgi:hypothetical protein
VSRTGDERTWARRKRNCVYSSRHLGKKKREREEIRRDTSLLPPTRRRRLVETGESGIRRVQEVCSTGTRSPSASPPGCEDSCRLRTSCASSASRSCVSRAVIPLPGTHLPVASVPVKFCRFRSPSGSSVPRHPVSRVLFRLLSARLRIKSVSLESCRLRSPSGSSVPRHPASRVLVALLGSRFRI